VRTDAHNTRPHSTFAACLTVFHEEINTALRPAQLAAAFAQQARAARALIQHAENVIETLQIIQPLHSKNVAVLWCYGDCSEVQFPASRPAAGTLRCSDRAERQCLRWLRRQSHSIEVDLLVKGHPCATAKRDLDDAS
jgi:heme oxygenase